jgi:predicted transcriptional regulator
MRIPFSQDRKDWVEVLIVLYENDLTKPGMKFPIKFGDSAFGESKKDIGSLARETNFSQQKVANIVAYLTEKELVYGENDALTLTNEGLQLAHQIKTERQRRNTNIILVVLTAVLTVLTIGLFGVEIYPLL